MIDEDDEFERLLKAVENWTPEAREKALNEFRARTMKTRKVWYCTGPDGRPNRPVFDASGHLAAPHCNGRAHDQYPYPHARADQWPPSGINWDLWFLIGGRGSGKTRTGAEYVRQISRRAGRIALVGATSQAVRDVMVEGDSGLKAVFAAAGEEIDFKPALRRIIFPSGAQASLFSAEEPDRLRGPQHHFFWMDEPSHFPDIETVWDQLTLGLRLRDGLDGKAFRVHGVCTSTPLPNKWTKARVAEPTTKVVRVSTRANLDNLDPSVARRIIDRYDGTRLGRQELDGEILPDVEGALWTEKLIKRQDDVPRSSLERIIVAIDPAGSNNKRSDETGIVVVGRVGRLGYVLEDRSGKYSPNGWADMAIDLYESWRADAIIAEKNFGGDMVKSTIESALKERDVYARIKVTTAARSKALRAEPIVALYEQSRIFHRGKLTALEEEMLTWIPGQGASPNRVDALVWGCTELFGAGGAATIARPPAGQRLPLRERYAAGASRAPMNSGRE
jgi:phage terminase large subunit-like protein